MDRGLRGSPPARPELPAPQIRFVYLDPRFRYRFLQTPPRGERPCGSLALHLHQVGRRTFTSKLLNMPSTQLNRWRGDTFALFAISRLISVSRLTCWELKNFDSSNSTCCET